MEHRKDGLLVDFSGSELQDTGKRVGQYPVVYSAKQEKELSAFDQEVALMRAMNEIREYQPKRMSTAEREMFAAICEKIFAKHGITAATYRQYFGHLGTRDQLRRA
jgi:hypothetical protein